MTQETNELKLKIETMTKTISSAELDSKASRYFMQINSNCFTMSFSL